MSAPGRSAAELTGPAAQGRQPDLAMLLRRWRDELDAWDIPAEIRGQGGAEPRLVRRMPDASGLPEVPAGSRSFVREWEALARPGSVIDVGAGTGDASLPLASRATLITAVDVNAVQLEVLERRARPLNVPIRTIHGRWPAAAPATEPADLVVCHYVLYEVRDLGPFIDALKSRARRRVVVTLPMKHPETAHGPLWEHFHGVSRPERPGARDVVNILEAMGLAPSLEVWKDVDGFGGYSSFDEMVDRTRRRLCLPPDRNTEVAQQLVQLRVDPSAPKSLGTVGREIATIWWEGIAG